MAANVQLSTEELRLMSDPTWILTKNSIMRKVVELFAEMSGEWRGMFPHDSDPKVSRGEQYKGLPWVMLDYPRVFGKEDVMAVRTMFWWGHCFMVTLHLKGSYLRSYLPVIGARREALEKAGFLPGKAEDEWEHEHHAGEWGEAAGLPFLKLSVQIGFENWTKIAEILTEKFAVLAEILVAA